MVFLHTPPVDDLRLSITNYVSSVPFYKILYTRESRVGVLTRSPMSRRVVVDPSKSFTKVEVTVTTVTVITTIRRIGLLTPFDTCREENKLE